MREIIDTPNAAQPKAPISQAVRIGNILFVSGITPFDLDLKIAVGDFDAQMRQVMANLTAILEAGGSSLAHVAKCTVYLVSQDHWPAMNRIYAGYWPDGSYPARTAIEARLPHPDFLIEIECVAEVPA